MGVQCTVLGHTYDGTESEERREDRADGTVLISREYQVCTRCGAQKELYRNEQLLPNRTPEASEDSSANEANSESHDAKTGVDPATDETQTAQSGSGSTAQSGDREPVAASDAVVPGPGTTPETTEEDAGGVILEADGGGRDSTERAGPEGRGFGEWPQEATAGSTDSEGQNSTDEQPTDDGVVLSGASESSSQAETDDSAQRSARTETADEWPTSTDAATAETERTLRGASETVSELSAFDTDEPSDPEIQCPNCDAGWARAETSLRDGDLCPDCRVGYVEVR
jgi:hypothetical protein